MKAGVILGITLILAVVVSGCTAPAQTGKLVLQITDQPKLDIEKAEVTISKIQVHLASGGNETNETNVTESGWITIVESSKTYDLVAIKDVKEFLGEKELGAGRYTQVRLDVDRATVTINGTEYNLTIPSKTVKLVRSFVIEANQTTTLTLDFDAEKSIHEDGANGKYTMRPTITITQE